MPRITDLQSILFPIAQEPLYSRRSDSEDPAQDPLREIGGYNAIINRANGDVLGVVSKAYGLVTNEQAVELGRRCCRELLSLDATDPLEVFNVDAPPKGTHCYVDLVHPSYKMNLLDRGARAEIYVPYVRVTNSYNATRALRFDVGFCRTLCSNGVIFEQETVRFRYAHVSRELQPEAIDFRIRAGQFEQLAERFKGFVRSLDDAPASEEWSRETLQRVLGLPSDSDVGREPDVRRATQMAALVQRAEESLARYRAELGPNAYAVFNAMTELARTVGSAPGMFRDTHSLQRAVGVWVGEWHRGVGRGVVGRQAA